MKVIAFFNTACNKDFSGLKPLKVAPPLCPRRLEANYFYIITLDTAKQTIVHRGDTWERKLLHSS